MPSPALITLAPTHSVTRSGAPEAWWRTTIASTPMASMVSTVSRSDSPFTAADVAAVKVMTSAESRLGRGLEREAGPRRRLHEDRRHGASPERGHLRDRALGDLGEGVREAHDLGDAVPAEIGDRQQVSARGPAASKRLLAPHRLVTRSHRRAHRTPCRSRGARRSRPRRSSRRRARRFASAGSCRRSPAGSGAPDVPGRP